MIQSLLAFIRRARRKGWSGLPPVIALAGC